MFWQLSSAGTGSVALSLLGLSSFTVNPQGPIKPDSLGNILCYRIYQPQFIHSILVQIVISYTYTAGCIEMVSQNDRGLQGALEALWWDLYLKAGLTQHRFLECFEFSVPLEMEVSQYSSVLLLCPKTSFVFVCPKTKEQCGLC